MNKVSFFILNVFLNSILTFFTAALLIEVVIFLFRIKQGRVAASIRMIPILKLPLDLCFYNFTKWTYAQGINPLDCAEGTRMITAGLLIPCSSDWVTFPLHMAIIQFTAPGNMTFTISDIIGYMVDPRYLKIFAVSLLFFSICSLIRKLQMQRRCMKMIRLLKTDAIPITRKVHNPHLMAHIKKGNYPIFGSSRLKSSPFVAGAFSPTIYLPSHFVESLSGKEYEAVLAHEIEHIRNRDIFIRFVLDIMMSIFWWVPTKWLRNKIEEDQEIGSDYRCRRYDVDCIDLASAICKSAKYTQNTFSSSFTYQLTQQKTLKRMKILLQPLPIQFYKTRLIALCLATGVAFLLILFGRFWIF